MLIVPGIIFLIRLHTFSFHTALQELPILNLISSVTVIIEPILRLSDHAAVSIRENAIF